MFVCFIAWVFVFVDSLFVCLFAGLLARLSVCCVFGRFAPLFAWWSVIVCLIDWLSVCVCWFYVFIDWWLNYVCLLVLFFPGPQLFHLLTKSIFVSFHVCLFVDVLVCRTVCLHVFCCIVSVVGVRWFLCLIVCFSYCELNN